MKNILNISFIFKIVTVLSILALICSYLSPFIHPNTFSIIPFFGLAYPIIIVVNLLLLLVWAIAGSKWSIYILAIILIGGKLHFRAFGVGSNKEKNQLEHPFKILSYNVRLFDVYNTSITNDFRNRDSIFSFLKREQADVLCFQEFYMQDDASKFKFSTKDTLYGLLRTPYFHSRMSFNKKYKNYFGVAIYSKYPMITKGHIEFENVTANTNNFCIFSDIVIEKDTFRVYNTHFQSIRFQKDDYAIFNEDEITGVEKSDIKKLFRKLKIAYQRRADQALKVIEHMKQSPYEVIICGDFNDTPLSYSYNLFYTNYVDAFKNCSKGLGITYAGKVPAGRIDYIFHSISLESSNFSIQKEIFSDHKAISCNIWKKKTYL